MILRTAQPEELPEAFRLLFLSTGDDAPRRAEHALRLVRSGEFDPQGIFVAVNQSHVDGVLICQSLPGAGSLIWPPRVRLQTQTEIEDQLIHMGLRYLHARGAKLTQTLLAADDSPLGVPLLRNGFRSVTSLWFMHHFLDLPAPLLQREDKLTFRDYTQVDPDLFARTLVDSYNGTLDCPELDGIRDPDEIIEGHRSQGKHRPELWWLASYKTAPVGVLLCTQLSESPGWELSYVGIVPAARRHGAGEALTCKALLEARAAEVPFLTLSVDARNLPAWNLYRKLGFETYDQRDVYLFLKDEG